MQKSNAVVILMTYRCCDEVYSYQVTYIKIGCVTWFIDFFGWCYQLAKVTEPVHKIGQFNWS